MRESNHFIIGLQMKMKINNLRETFMVITIEVFLYIIKIKNYFIFIQYPT